MQILPFSSITIFSTSTAGETKVLMHWTCAVDRSPGLDRSKLELRSERVEILMDASIIRSGEGKELSK